MKKRILCLLCSAVLLFATAGCSTPGTNSDKMQIVCTVFPAYDFARQVVGDTADVTLLLAPGQECHTYEPTPRDMAAVQNCDLFFCVGGESEEWVRGLIDDMGQAAPPVLRMIDCVDTVAEEATEGMAVLPDGEADEHVWTSPQNAIRIVSALTDRLCELNGAAAETFQNNAAGYRASLSALDEAFAAAVAAADTRTLIFADRFPFRYFTDRYGLTPVAAFPGCAEDTEAAPATVMHMIDKVKAESIPVILYIEFSNQKIADTVCEATGAEKRLFHSCHNVTAREFESGATYLSLMTDNLAVLKEALGV